MYETADDIRWLQALLDRSHARMGPHMRSILTPERTLTARQVVTHVRGIKHVALATVTATGTPRVGPLDGLFIRGRFHVGTGGDEVAVTVHGTAILLGREQPEAAALEPIYVELYGSSPFGWGEGVILVRVEPDAMYAYAPDPDRFPSA